MMQQQEQYKSRGLTGDSLGAGDSRHISMRAGVLCKPCMVLQGYHSFSYPAASCPPLCCGLICMRTCCTDPMDVAELSHPRIPL
jgi:hypothetical protein